MTPMPTTMGCVRERLESGRTDLGKLKARSGTTESPTLLKPMNSSLDLDSWSR